MLYCHVIFKSDLCFNSTWFGPFHCFSSALYCSTAFAHWVTVLTVFQTVFHPNSSTDLLLRLWHAVTSPWILLSCTTCIWVKVVEKPKEEHKYTEWTAVLWPVIDKLYSTSIMTARAADQKVLLEFSRMTITKDRFRPKSIKFLFLFWLSFLLFAVVI